MELGYNGRQFFYVLVAFASCSQTGFLTIRSDNHGPKRRSVLMQSALTIDRDKAMFCSRESCFLFGSYLWFKSIPPALQIAGNQISLSAITMPVLAILWNCLSQALPPERPLLLKRWGHSLAAEENVSDCRHMLKMISSNHWVFSRFAFPPLQVGLFHFYTP